MALLRSLSSAREWMRAATWGREEGGGPQWRAKLPPSFVEAVGNGYCIVSGAVQSFVRRSLVRDVGSTESRRLRDCGRMRPLGFGWPVHSVLG